MRKDLRVFFMTNLRRLGVGILSAPRRSCLGEEKQTEVVQTTKCENDPQSKSDVNIN